MASTRFDGTQLKRARERRHLTQQELADRLGVDRKTIDNWENNRTYPRSRLGAIYDWAPELAQDMDENEIEFHDAMTRLRENPILEGFDLTPLTEAFEERKLRARRASARVGRHAIAS